MNHKVTEWDGVDLIGSKQTPVKSNESQSCIICLEFSEWLRIYYHLKKGSAP